MAFLPLHHNHKGANEASGSESLLTVSVCSLNFSRPPSTVRFLLNMLSPDVAATTVYYSLGRSSLPGCAESRDHKTLWLTSHPPKSGSVASSIQEQVFPSYRSPCGKFLTTLSDWSARIVIQCRLVGPNRAYPIFRAFFNLSGAGTCN